jgi:hypothetical protein
MLLFLTNTGIAGVFTPPQGGEIVSVVAASERLFPPASAAAGRACTIPITELEPVEALAPRHGLRDVARVKIPLI